MRQRTTPPSLSSSGAINFFCLIACDCTLLALFAPDTRNEGRFTKVRVNDPKHIGAFLFCATTTRLIRATNFLCLNNY